MQTIPLYKAISMFLKVCLNCNCLQLTTGRVSFNSNNKLISNLVCNTSAKVLLVHRAKTIRINLSLFASASKQARSKYTTQFKGKASLIVV